MTLQNKLAMKQLNSPGCRKMRFSWSKEYLEGLGHGAVPRETTILEDRVVALLQHPEPGV